MRTLIDHRVLHRRNDPLHEYRELRLYQTEIHYSVWEVIGFLGQPDLAVNEEESLMSLGSEDTARGFLKTEASRLCRNEGFSLVEFNSFG